MIPTAVIAFREFLEAFLIVGVFLGISRKMNLKKEGEIYLAAFTGVDREFSLPRLLIMILYIAGIYAIVKYRRVHEIKK